MRRWRRLCRDLECKSVHSLVYDQVHLLGHAKGQMMRGRYANQPIIKNQQGKAMPFEDCACHVWAIDGYRDDDTAELVNNAYATCATSLRTTNTAESRQEALVALLKAARAEIGTTNGAKLYGGFRRGQKAPEHMWLEFDGYIYDTMPGYGLCRVAVSSKSRKCPGLENEDFGSGAVCIDMTLTASQLTKIREGEFIDPV